ncbi:cytochrome P450 family protein [Streptomyces alkaliterrae]|nr:cytochrome P450 [Streptomyces alkaliterrae]
MPESTPPIPADPSAVIDLVELADEIGTPMHEDPHAVFGWLAARGPVHRVRVPVFDKECWLVVGHAEARAALLDDRLRNDIRHSADWTDDGGYAVGHNMLQSDPPQHTRLRRLVSAEFTARRVAAMRPRVRQLVDELLDALPATGPADLVESLALPLPMAVICELMGVPESDRADFHSWSSEVVAPTSAEAAGAAAGALSGYFAELIARRRAEGGEDLLSALVRSNTADAAEERLSDEELLGMAFLLLVAGHETTVNLIGGGLLELLRRPAQLAALRADAGLLENAVEEMLRHVSPVQTSSFRFAAEPVTVAGREIPAGASVLVGLAAAARAASVAPRPDEFDVRRPPEQSRAHLAFGHGAHFCLGAPLARLETAIALGSLLERRPRVRLDPDRPVTWRPSAIMLRGPATLPVRFD